MDAARPLEGLTAIVTGASRGIGAAIAGAYAAAGARVVLAARKPDALEAVAGELRAAGGVAHAVPCHVGDPEQTAALVARAVELGEGVDVLVNNAATNPHYGPLLEADAGSWDKTFDVNLKGTFALTREVVGHLRARGAGGAVVNVASVLGLMGAPRMGVYAMTKAALVSMTRTLAMELGRAGIRVNALAPGLIETRFAQALVDDDRVRGAIEARTALGRIGQPDDVAGAAVFLASPTAAYVTGQVLTVDGGWTVA